MPDVRAELVQRYYSLIDAGRVDEMLALFDEEATYVRGGTPPMRGKAELTEFYQRRRIIENGLHEIFSIVSQGEWVAVRGRFAGTLKSGEAVDVQFADFHRIDGGCIRERFTYFQDQSI
jgi:ketosteroid isomerase-like protein